MRTGPLISGAGHAAILALAVFGLPWLSPRDAPPIRVTEVSFVSEAEFAAAQSAADAPREPDAPAEAPAPAVETAETLEAPETPAVPEPAPVQSAPPPPPRDLAPAFDPEAPLAAAPDGVTFAPVLPATTPGSTTVSPPRPRPIERIVAEPVEIAPPTPPAEIASPEAPVIAELPEPEPEPTPPEPEVVPPTPAPPPGFVAEAAPPLPRRGNVGPAPAAQAPEPQPEPEIAAAEPEPTPPRTPAAPAAPRAPAPAPAAPAAPATPAATSLPMGPPITDSERDGLRLAVQRCWNLPAGLRDAQDLRVTLAVQLTATGEIVDGSIRLIEPNPPPDGRFQQAFEAGRRALIRCSPYTGVMPPGKYARWRNIEAVFNPEGLFSW